MTQTLVQYTKYNNMQSKILTAT